MIGLIKYTWAKLRGFLAGKKTIAEGLGVPAPKLGAGLTSQFGAGLPTPPEKPLPPGTHDSTRGAEQIFTMLGYVRNHSGHLALTAYCRHGSLVEAVLCAHRLRGVMPPGSYVTVCTGWRAAVGNPMHVWKPELN